MNSTSIRNLLIATLHRTLTLRSALLTEQELRASALILSPHYDDETLGCGGTIRLKTAVGAKLHIIFITDGTASHSHLMNSAELGRIRREEAIAACDVLGVAPEHVTHIGIPDGEVEQHQRSVIDRIGEVMDALQPAQIYCPYRADGNQDHEAVYRATVAAMHERQIRAKLFEFPIWAWHMWPWCRIQLQGRSHIPLHAAIAFHRNLLLIKRINRCAVLGSAKTYKKGALDCHRSQMVRMIDDRRWVTLSDVALGDFLQKSLDSEEWFVCS